MQKYHTMQVELFQSPLNLDAGYTEALNVAKNEFCCERVSAILREVKYVGYGKGQYVLIFTVSAEDVD